MLLQVARDYAGLPDPRSLTLSEIRFFYEALRPELKKHSRPGAGPKPPRLPSLRR